MIGPETRSTTNSRVTNTGNVTLNPVGVDDPAIGTVTCPETRLAPADTTLCSATYTLTQGDVDAGHFANLATAIGTPPAGADVTASDETDSPIESAPAITLDKQAGVPSGVRAGDTIDYTFLVTNTGNVSLDPVSVGDPTVGDVTCPESALAPDASMTCEATYALTQSDVDLGHRANSATANGSPPLGDDVTATDDTDTTIEAAPAITLVKQAGAPSGNRAGDTIDYTFLVTNTGNVTLDPIGVNDPVVGAVNCPESVLAPEDATTCEATYVLTQADVDAGEVVNVATALGTPPVGDAVVSNATVTTGIPAEPAVALDKFVTAISGVDAGDTVDYSFVVTNTGNVTLDSISVDDPLVGTVDCPVGELAPGASTTCLATYTLEQADVDAAEVVNFATASATAPNGDVVAADDSTSTGIPGDPAIVLDKQAGTPSWRPPRYQGGRHHRLHLHRHQHRQRDARPGERGGSVARERGLSRRIAPAGRLDTCQATYVLTQLDMDSGHVANTATASATPPVGDDATATDDTDSPIVSAPAITLDKQAATPTGNSAGDTIDYSFVVTNSGNVTLDAVGVEDPLVGAVTCPAATLAPIESTTCTATYTLTQSDVDAGHVANTAVATGILTDRSGRHGDR